MPAADHHRATLTVASFPTAIATLLMPIRRQLAPEIDVVVIDAEPAARFAVGDRVFHQKFGTGSVMGIAEDTLTVEFPAGFKTIKAAYVQPASDAASDDVPF